MKDDLKTSLGVKMIREERLRQIAVEGFTPEFDDQYDRPFLIEGAKAYLTARYQDWPPAFSPEMFKLGPDRVRELVKAGAMIAAEIDRLVRLHLRTTLAEKVESQMLAEGTTNE